MSRGGIHNTGTTLQAIRIGISAGGSYTTAPENNEQASFSYLDSPNTTSATSYHVSFGKYDNNWGPGKRSIHISNKSPSYPKFGIRLEINKKLAIDYFHGILHSGIIDSTRSKYYQHVWENSEYESKIGSRNITINRYIA